jgi:hypothetical protein
MQLLDMRPLPETHLQWLTETAAADKEAFETPPFMGLVHVKPSNEPDPWSSRLMRNSDS